MHSNWGVVKVKLQCYEIVIQIITAVTNTYEIDSSTTCTNLSNLPEQLSV